MIRKTALLCIIAIVLLIMVLRLNNLQIRIEPSSESAPPVTETEDALLFKHLRHSGLLTSKDNNELELPPPDLILTEKARQARTIHASPSDLEDTEYKARLMKILFHTPVGRMVRKQVRLWNNTRARQPYGIIVRNRQVDLIMAGK